MLPSISLALLKDGGHLSYAVFNSAQQPEQRVAGMGMLLRQ